MNTSNVLACITISILFGFGVGYGTGQQDNGKFTIHKTRSGMFILDDSRDKKTSTIYEVLEMPTNKKSFQDQEIEFK